MGVGEDRLDMADCVFSCCKYKQEKGNRELNVDSKTACDWGGSSPTPVYSFSDQWRATQDPGTTDWWHQLDFQFVSYGEPRRPAVHFLWFSTNSISFFLVLERLKSAEGREDVSPVQ